MIESIVLAVMTVVVVPVRGLNDGIVQHETDRDVRLLLAPVLNVKRGAVDLEARACAYSAGAVVKLE